MIEVSDQSSRIFQDELQLPIILPLQDNLAFKKLLSDLNDKQTKLDRMLIDLYHYAYIHPQLSASKGYKLYRIIREVAARRFKVKSQIQAILQCEETSYQYKPRSDLFDQLSNLL